ncbi:MAG: MBL fold metallo-hydrolase [Spirochaetae bacterium HGW-Spirochaetae-8]|nr:MAG: MBL fold metallo-hydrolase [Spirochaetae bacterium HGW-Spirochaetae-8]
MQITFLGTGTSHGVPRIGCDCPVCTSSDSRNNRMRASVWIQHDGLSVVVDTGPEFRIQALRAGIKQLDAVFYTHDHADHMNGIDDLRVFSEIASLPIYGPAQVLDDIAHRFPYAVGSNPWRGGLPQLTLNPVPSTGAVCGPLVFIPVPLIHGCREVYGYRIGDFAYLTDCKEIPATSMLLLRGVRILVLDALRPTVHPTHLNIEEAVAAARLIGATSTYLTHMNHRVDYEAIDLALPPDIHPAYDGLVLQV